MVGDVDGVAVGAVEGGEVEDIVGTDVGDAVTYDTLALVALYVAPPTST